MAVYVNNLVINSGEDFSQEITFETPIDEIINLTGYSALSYIRKHPESSKIVAGFGVSFFNPSSGKIRLSLGSTITSSIPEGRYVYDVLITKTNGSKQIVLEGMVNVRSGVSS